MCGIVRSGPRFNSQVLGIRYVGDVWLSPVKYRVVVESAVLWFSVDRGHREGPV